MEKVIITIETGNAAFDGEMLEEEVKRILHDLAYKIGNAGINEGKIRDINGNTCGTVETE